VIIDVNAYLGHFAFRRLRHNTARSLLALMDRASIDRAAVSSASAITYRNPQAGNEEVAAEIKSHSDRLVGFAVLNPAYAGWRDDLKICHQQFGMRGVRLYPRWHNYRLSDRQCRELVEAAADLSMVISIPLRVEDRRQGSWLVDIPDVDREEIASLIRVSPNARFILVNGSGYETSSLGRKGSGLPSNYVIDIALLTAEVSNETSRLIENLGEDRIVFGTGMPFHYPGPALTKVQVLDLKEPVKDRIRWRTAASVLGISG
jgi:predicted TIM-barrel fold metal-dependent hydrolase